MPGLPGQLVSNLGIEEEDEDQGAVTLGNETWHYSKSLGSMLCSSKMLCTVV